MFQIAMPALQAFLDFTIVHFGTLFLAWVVVTVLNEEGSCMLLPTWHSWSHRQICTCDNFKAGQIFRYLAQAVIFF